MNDENREDRRVEGGRREEDLAASTAEAMVSVLQDDNDALQARVAELEAERDAAPPLAAAPAGDAELRGLAGTYRTAVRNGHPDAPKHLEALLGALGV